MDQSLYMFRVKVTNSNQHPLFSEGQGREQILRQILMSAPTMSGKGSAIWHVGNYEEIESSAVYFRLGKTTRARESQFDEATLKFIDTQLDVAPYSHAILDTRLGVLGLSPNYRLAPQCSGIARRLARVLGGSEKAVNEDVSVDVSEIPDPTGFVALIRESFQVAAFSMEFGRPNPIDVNRDFQRPMERLLAEMNGDVGRTTIRGREDLDRDVIESLSRSAAASGNDASIKVRETPASRLALKSIRGNASRVQIEAIETPESKRIAAERIISQYLEIRGTDVRNR